MKNTITVPAPRQLPSGSWFIQLRLSGVSVPVTAATEKECIRQAQLIKAEYKAGKSDVLQSKANPTLKQAMEAYISARSNMLSPSTIRGYEIIKEHRFQSVADKKLKTITDWQKLINAEAKGLSPKSLKNAWFFVASVLKEQGYSVPDVILPQTTSVEHAYLAPDQIQPFVKAIKGQRCEIAALLGLSSLRVSEICALSWDNVDLAAGTITVSGAAVYDKDNKLVHKAANKNDSSRRTVLILMPELAEALKAVESKSGLVVKQRPNTIFRQVNAVCASANLPLDGVHGLRHSFATQLIARSTDVARFDHGYPFAHGTMRSICSRHSFFLVCTCANSSFRADRLICLFMTLFYHLAAFLHIFFVRCCLRILELARLSFSPLFLKFFPYLCKEPGHSLMPQPGSLTG